MQRVCFLSNLAKYFFLVNFCITSTSLCTVYECTCQKCALSQYLVVHTSLMHLPYRHETGREWAGKPLHTDTYTGTAYRRRPVASDSAAPCWEQQDLSWITKTFTRTYKVLDTRSYNSAVNRPRSACWWCLILIQNKEVHLGWGFKSGFNNAYVLKEAWASVTLILLMPAPVVFSSLFQKLYGDSCVPSKMYR